MIKKENKKYYYSNFSGKDRKITSRVGFFFVSNVVDKNACVELIFGEQSWSQQALYIILNEVQNFIH